MARWALRLWSPRFWVGAKVAQPLLTRSHCTFFSGVSMSLLTHTSMLTTGHPHTEMGTDRPVAWSWQQHLTDH